MENLEQNIFNPDTPLIDPKLDKFKRFPFAQRVAEIITNLKDPNSIIIGIYGKWGEGKSTVLNFIEKELTKENENKNIICVCFNPWYFGDEVSLIKSFFDTLEDSLIKNMPSKEKIIRKYLKYYANVISGLKLGLTLDLKFVKINFEKIIKNPSDKLSSVEINKIKKQIEDILESEKKRVVVFIDDIDRLDKNEIQTVFKLIKLCADFNYIVYIVAFDEEMVASALGEKYSSNSKESEKDKESGKDFIEKIVQIPLRLPKLDIISLLNLCSKCVQNSLRISNIELSDEQYKEFLKHFSAGFLATLKTPRMCKRYGNAIVSTLPMIKDEVNIVDFLLIEGIRIFYPKVYEFIRNNPQIFPIPENLLGKIHKDIISSLNKILNDNISNFNDEGKKSVRYLLKTLFPNIEKIFDNVEEKYYEDKKWELEKRVTSEKYFKRYFAYAVPEGDIPDQQINDFILKVDIMPIDDVIPEIKKIVNSRNSGMFVLKIRNINLNKKLSPSISQKLAIALSKLVEIFPNSYREFPITTPFETLFTPFQTLSWLVSDLINNIPKGQRRYNVAEDIINKCESFTFAIELFIEWLLDDENKEDNIFSSEEKKNLGETLANRIRNLAEEKKPIYLEFPNDSPNLLYIWAKYRSKNEVSRYIEETLDLNKYNVSNFLNCYAPDKGVLLEKRYSDIEKVVNTKIIFNKLYDIYGHVLDLPKYAGDLMDLSYEEKIAHQFAYIYHKTKKEKQTEGI
jgi:DNA polymerase III delta prime subunit